MPVYSSLSTWMKIALVCLSLGVLLFVIGFATEDWMVAYMHSRGLWKLKVCNRYSCNSGPYGNNEPDYLKATQAMECIGLICVLLAFIVFFLYIFVDSCRRRDAMLAIIFLCFGAVLAMVIGYAIFGSKLSDHGYKVGWSMGVAIAGTVCTFVAGIMFVLHLQGR